MDKEFVVSHAKARSPVTVRGKNLKEALKNEGLDPSIWKPISPPEPIDIPTPESLSDADPPT